MTGILSEYVRYDFAARAQRDMRNDLPFAGSDAPFNTLIMIEVTDGRDRWRLPTSWRRTADGWINARSRKPLADGLTVVGAKLGTSWGVNLHNPLAAFK